MIPAHDAWAHAWGGPPVAALMRARAADFHVHEVLPSAPAGSGKYLWLQVRKRHLNTDWLAGELARFAGIPRALCGYAGRKDRHAETVQWFSLELPPEREPDWATLDLPGAEILDRQRHSQWLRPGDLLGNRFRLVLREIDGDCARLDARLRQIAKRGVPNYFGAQRFGHDGSNLAGAAALFSGRAGRLSPSVRGMYLSAARSLLFNAVLSARVADGSWQTPLPGEVIRLGHSDSLVTLAQPGAGIAARVDSGELQLTGPLWGRGSLPAGGDVRALEQQVTACLCRGDDAAVDWCHGLEQAGLRQERRALCLLPQQLAWELDGSNRTLALEFFLPAGAYATAVVRELARVREPDRA